MRQNLRNIHRVRRRGKLYYYHRKTKVRLPGDPGSTEFMRAWTAEEESLGGPTTIEGTLGGLIAHYRASDKFKMLAPRSRADYQGVLDYLFPIRDTPLVRLSLLLVVKIRDKANKAKGRTFANKLLSVLSVMSNHGRLYGLMTENPVEGVPHIQRPKGMPEANRPWSDIEVAAFLKASPPGVRTAVALGAYAAIREGDALKLTWSAIRDGAIEVRQAKTGDVIWLPLRSELIAVLDSIAKVSPQIVTGLRGKPYTGDGFRTMFQRIRAELEASGEVDPGLTFHGLRHTAATNLADAGCDDRDIMAVTGHKSVSMVQKYTDRADRKRHATSAIARMNREQKL